MGIRGLTTYIADNSTTYLKSYELSNCYLVIDGNGVACYLYNWRTKSYSAFGGDYDEFYKIVKDFFLLLKKCNVKPIVIFDGGHEKRKIKTIIARGEGLKPILKQYLHGFSTTRVFPLFLKRTFCDVLEDLGIFCVQSYLEADIEVAAVARALNCPVLSNDSDFYIFDVLYIPLHFLQLEPIKRANSNNYFLKCMLYDVTNFLSVFSGLDKSLLPILATLLGNDYVRPSLFQKFFNHVTVEKVKNKSFMQSKIHGALHWLKSENAESAIELILSHVEKSMKGKVLKAIQTSINDYTSNAVSESVFNTLILQIGDFGLSKKDFNTKLPPEIISLFHKCKISSFVFDIITLGCYFTCIQLEVINRPSHFESLELIRCLINTLQPYAEHSLREVKLFCLKRGHYAGTKIYTDRLSLTGEQNSLYSLLKGSRETRLKWLFKIVEIDEDELKIVSLDNSWSIFLLSYIYWLKKLGSELTHTHIHALLLMAIVNEVAQKSVGYFRNTSKFTKNKGNLLNNLQRTPIKVGEGNSLEEMMKSVSLHEKLLIQKEVIPYRLTTENAIESYSIITIHYFSCFQSILYHIMEINALLNFPFPHLKISDFYSGTLLYNFFLSIKTKPTPETFGATLLKKTPNLARIYTYLCENLAKFFPENPVPARKPKKKTRKKKRSSQEEEEEDEEKEYIFLAVQDDSDAYDDENNYYSILKNIDINL